MLTMAIAGWCLCSIVGVNPDPTVPAVCHYHCRCQCHNIPPGVVAPELLGRT